ncbi:MAG: response regulator [Proteobacteria bacterium]|nr:response regulator [Pseudomonadota bacterium]
MTFASEKRILVVDDEPDIRDFLSTCLEDAGFQVETAVDGFDALAKIEKSIPDLITLDLVMPRISGIKLMRKLRKTKEWKEIPVIIVTAHAKDELGKEDADALYAEEVKPAPEHIIEKPITPSKLVIAIGKILGVKTELDVATERSDIVNLVKTCSPEELKKIQGLLG